MRRLAQTILVTVTTAGLAAAVALPADATAPALRFGRFYADQPGSDTPYTTAKLDHEYIQVKNVSRTTQSLAGYLLHDRGSKHIYLFPSGFRLGAGRTVTVHTGSGRNTSTDLYWGRKSMVWNNGTRAGVVADTAYLVKGRSTVATCNYIPSRAQLNARTGYTNC